MRSMCGCRAEVPLAEAEAIVCTGLRDDRTETVADYRALIEEGVARKVPFVCADPDLVVDVGTLRLPCAAHSPSSTSGWAARSSGRQAAPAAYATARERAAELRGAMPEPSASSVSAMRCARSGLAQGLGVDGLFIAAGIHTEDVLASGQIDASRVGRPVRATGTPPAIAAMTHLRW